MPWCASWGALLGEGLAFCQLITFASKNRTLVAAAL
jgi:hypothetical protein